MWPRALPVLLGNTRHPARRLPHPLRPPLHRRLKPRPVAREQPPRRRLIARQIPRDRGHEPVRRLLGPARPVRALGLAQRA